MHRVPTLFLALALPLSAFAASPSAPANGSLHKDALSAQEQYLSGKHTKAIAPVALGSGTGLVVLKRHHTDQLSVGRSTTIDFSILNPGSQTTLTALRPAIVGPHRADFMIEDNSCGTTLAPASRCTIRVVWSPRSAYELKGTALQVSAANLKDPVQTSIPGVSR